MKKLLFIVGTILLAFVIAWFLPLPSALNLGGTYALSVQDRTGAALATLYGENRGELLTYDKIPPDFVDALIATEDRTFMANPGLSLRGVLRAFVHDLQSMSSKEGGSTITQQLVRQRLHPRRRTLLYKVREMWLSLKITQQFSKKTILESFISSAFFGQQSYGLTDAALTYFGKSPSRLSLSESALLVGLLNAPSTLNPFRNPEGAIARRNLVLRALLATHKISTKEAEEAQAEQLLLTHVQSRVRAPHFVSWILDGDTHHRSIQTTLDLELQSTTENIVSYQLEKLHDKNVTGAAVVVLDAKTGELLTMVGSADFANVDHDGQVNLALAKRQPGSALKPFTYALALEHGMTAATTIADIEAQFMTSDGNAYTPRNYDYEHHGLVRLREALANSYNIVAIKVLERIGVQTLLDFLKSAGISSLSDSPERYGLALTLGDGEVSLLELTTAYGVFARGGTTLSVRTRTDDPIVPSHQILDPSVAWLVSDILSDGLARLPEFGSSGPLSFNFPVAAKTGTTRNSRDNWTIGFTPTRIVGVWVGNADNSPMKGTSGVTGAGPIFHDVMIEAMKNHPLEEFLRPANIIDVPICTLSGKLPTQLCPKTMIEHFIKGTEPSTPDDIYQTLSVDRRNNMLAGETCDRAQVVQKVFTVVPPELNRWAREAGWPVPPTEVSPLCHSTVATETVDGIHISEPKPEASFFLDPLIPDDNERILLSGIADGHSMKGTWFIDGKRLSEVPGPDFKSSWIPRVGKHIIRLQSGSKSDEVNVEVIDSR